jgi:hypothetical protein
MSENMMQLPDGRWVPAQPLPFCNDARPFHVRLGHMFLIFFGWDEDELMEKWWVPVEPGRHDD